MDVNTRCENCGSYDIDHSETYGFYECQSCGEVWGLAEDDPDLDEFLEDYDYGPCCACGSNGDASNRVRNLLMLDKKAPIPGTGWGCVICGLSPDGAMAILCDKCLDSKQQIQYAFFGYPTGKKRCSIEVLTEDFKHKDGYHQNTRVERNG